MAELEDKMLDSKREMQIADALDEIRTRNARIERTEALGDQAAIATAQEKIDEEALRAAKAEEEQREADRQLFRVKKRAAQEAALIAEEEARAARVAQPMIDWANIRQLPRRRVKRLKVKGITAKPKPSEE